MTHRNDLTIEMSPVLRSLSSLLFIFPISLLILRYKHENFSLSLSLSFTLSIFTHFFFQSHSMTRTIFLSRSLFPYHTFSLFLSITLSLSNDLFLSLPIFLYAHINGTIRWCLSVPSLKSIRPL